MLGKGGISVLQKSIISLGFDLDSRAREIDEYDFFT